MKYLIFENIAVLVCSVIGILSGIRYLNTWKTIFAGMIVHGVICIALGRLFQCALLWTGGMLTEHFQLGCLGTIGAFAFFFSANFGQIDSLVDGGEAQYRKHRIIALIGPIYVVSMLIPIMVSPATRVFKIGSGVVSCIIGAACYFHVKHLIIPDVDYGVVRCLRGYNALAVVLSVMSMWELIALAWSADTSLYISGIGLCAASLALVPVMDRGVKKWTT